MQNRGTWVAQLDKHRTLDFGSGHDLTVWEFKPAYGSVLRVQSLLGILSPAFFVPPLLAISLSKINKNKLKKKRKMIVAFIKLLNQFIRVNNNLGQP